MSDIKLSQLSILRNRVLTSEKAYHLADLGYAYQEHELLRLARNEYAQESVKFVEQLLDSQCKSCENLLNEYEVEHEESI